MGTHSDGYEEPELLTTVVTCEGDLSDPQFNAKFSHLFHQLQKLLLKDRGQYLDVVKIEPWNSVRVTFTVPKEAALKLRQLAQQRDATLSQLGILSVQLEGDQAISLRIAGRVSGESQEIVLKTGSADSSDTAVSETNHLISGSASAASTICENTASVVRTMTQVLAETGISHSMPSAMPSFKSPNAIAAPLDKMPLPYPPSTSSKINYPIISTAAVSSNSYQTFPFANMSHAVQNPNEVLQTLQQFSTPPPPYPTQNSVQYNKSRSVPLEACSSNPSPANVALSSPLLVNLLQNDGVVPINSNKIISATDKQKLKVINKLTPFPSNTAKRKHSAPEPTNSLHHSGNSAFVSVNSESLVAQSVQKNDTRVSDPCSSHVVTKSLSLDDSNLDSAPVKIQSVLNHVNFLSKQTPVVNMFQRSASAPGPLVSNPQRNISLPNSPSHQLLNRISVNENSLTFEQAQKLGLRLINIQQPQQPVYQQKQHAVQNKHTVLQQIKNCAEDKIKINQNILSSSSLSNAVATFASDSENLSLALTDSASGSSSINNNSNGVMVCGSNVTIDNLQHTIKTTNNAISTSSSIEQQLRKSSNFLNCTIAPSTSTINNMFPSSIAGNIIQRIIRPAISQENPAVTCSSFQFTTKPSNVAVFQNSNNVQVTSSSLQQPNKSTHIRNSGTHQENWVQPLPNVPLSFQTSPNEGSMFIDQSLCSISSNSTKGISPITSQHTAQTTPRVKKRLGSKQHKDSKGALCNFVTSESVADGTSQLDLCNLPPNDDLLNTKISSDSSLTSPPLTLSVNEHIMNGPMELQHDSQPGITNTTTTSMESKEVKVEKLRISPHFTTSDGKERQFLINPLTGEMEPMPSESSSDSEPDNTTDIFSSLPPASNEDTFFNFSSPLTNDKSNSAFSDEDDNVKSPSKKNEILQSDTEASFKSSDNNRNRMKNNASTTSCSASHSTNPGEKIKLRLKLEKNEPIVSAYKVDLSFVNSSTVKKQEKPVSRVLTNVTSSVASSSLPSNLPVSILGEELRVPPLHISLRGRNAAVVKKDKKWGDETKDSSEDTDKKNMLKFKTISKEISDKKDDDSENRTSPTLLNSSDNSEIETNESKLVNKFKKSDSEDSQPSSQGDSITEPSLSFGPVLTPVRTFPTEAEITSILRSVPCDAPNKMSLSCVKVKKKEAKKKLGYSRDSGSTLGDDSTDLFTRVINDTKTSLSQAKTKSRTGSSVSLLRSVMKSSAAKEVRMIGASIANRHLEKRQLSNVNSNSTTTTITTSITTTATTITSSSNPALHNAAEVNNTFFKSNTTNNLPPTQQKRVTSEITSSASQNILPTTTRLNIRPNDTQVTTMLSIATVSSSSSYVPSPYVANNVYNSHHKDVTKKIVNNISVNKKVSSSYNRSKDYRNSKFDIRRDLHGKNDIKRSGNLMKKNSFDTECKAPSVVTVGCVQVISKINNPSGFSTAQLDMLDKVRKEQLIEDIENLEKKDLVDVLKTDMLLERLIPESSKDTDNIIGVGDSPTGPVGEQVNNQGEDSGIESMDALSEKSPNQGESPCRKEEKEMVIVDPASCKNDKVVGISVYCEKSNIKCGDDLSLHNRVKNVSNDECEQNEDNTNVDCSSNFCDNNQTAPFDASQLTGNDLGTNYCDKNENRTYIPTQPMSSPDDLEDVRPFRLTPALYTYSNPEKIRVDSPSPTPLEDISEELPPCSPKKEDTKILSRMKRKRKEHPADSDFLEVEKSVKTIHNSCAMDRYNNRNNASNSTNSSQLIGKSLLEQLLIDIPTENVEIKRTGMSTRNTRSQLRGLNQHSSPDRVSLCSSSSSSSTKTPKSSPRSEDVTNKPSPRSSSRANLRRSRKGQERNTVFSSEDTNTAKWNKRKSTENIIISKPCYGFEDFNKKSPAQTTSYSCASTMALSTPLTTALSIGVNDNHLNATYHEVNDKRNSNRSSGLYSARNNTTRPTGKRKRGIDNKLQKSETDNPFKQDTGDQNNIAAALLESSLAITCESSLVTKGNSSNRSNNTVVAHSLAAVTSRRSVRNNHTISRPRRYPTNILAKCDKLTDVINTTTTTTTNNNDTSNSNSNNNAMNSDNINNISDNSNSCNSRFSDNSNDNSILSNNNEAKLSKNSDETIGKGGTSVIKFEKFQEIADISKLQGIQNKDDLVQSLNSNNNNNNDDDDNSNSNNNNNRRDNGDHDDSNNNKNTAKFDNSNDKNSDSNSSTSSSSNSSNDNNSIISNSGSVCSDSISSNNSKNVINTRGASNVKHLQPLQPQYVNNEGTSAVPSSQDNVHHNVLNFEDVINTRRKTRSVASLNDAEVNGSGRRRKNSRDGK